MIPRNIAMEIAKEAEGQGLKTAIVVINGALGDGKTLLSTYLALGFRNRGIPVYSNYHIDGCDRLDTLLGMKDFSGAVVAIDDAITEGFDSYSQMGKGSRLHTKLLRFARKRDLIILFTQQIETGIAKRVRHITNYVFDTIQLKYPYFHLRGYMPTGYCWLDIGIKYNPIVSDSYNTREEVYQTMSKERLQELWDLSASNVGGKITQPNRTIFKDLVTGDFGVDTGFAGTIYECVKDSNYDALEVLAGQWGYRLE